LIGQSKEPACSPRAPAFSAGGDGVRKSPEVKRNLYTAFAASSVTPRARVLTNAQIAAPAFLGHNHRLSKKRQWFPKNCNRVVVNNEVKYSRLIGG
jgi:hypothetical protein